MTPQEIKLALQRVSPAVAENSIYDQHCAFLLLKDGRVYAQNGNLRISTPCDIDGAFLVSGQEFQRAIDKLPIDKLNITHNEDSVIVKGGQFRTTIQTLPLDLFTMPIPKGKRIVELDVDKFLYALEQLSPFISKDSSRTFGLFCFFSQGRAFATNNMVIVECADTGLPSDIELLLPQSAADYVLLMKDQKILDITINETAAVFNWEDGTQMVTNLGAQKWPQEGLDMVGEVRKVEHIINEDWRKDVLSLRDFGDSEITIYIDRIEVGRGRSKTRLNVTSPIPKDAEFSCWGFKTIELILQKATHIDFTNWPKPMTFEWDGIRGLAAAHSKGE